MASSAQSARHRTPPWTAALVGVIAIMPPLDPGSCAGGSTGPTSTRSGAYDSVVLADRPVAYWRIDPKGGTESDLAGHGHTGTYLGGIPALAALPDGDTAADLNGINQYLTIPAQAALSIPATGNLTWEAWLRPDVLQFLHATSDGFVAFLGKCATYAPTCEWEGRMYSTNNPQSRCNRLSAYVFNPSAGLGSGAFWQPACGLLQAGEWLHVVGEYTTLSQPANCPTSAAFPGSIDIWVNGVRWDQAAHKPTGCMSQYSVAPQAGGSPVNIGSMAQDSWFAGAIGKVAIYDYLLSASQIARHYQAMTGRAPTGSCAATCSF